MLIIHHEALLDWIRPHYTAEHLQRLREFLRQQATFDFPTLPTGLFSASVATHEDLQYTGYSAVWVRDNMHVANALWTTGDVSAAVKAAQAVMQCYVKHRHRLEGIVSGRADPQDVMQRPHIRFDGQTLDEFSVKWAHAQNDALGYFLWLYCRLAVAGHVTPTAPEREILAGFIRYYRTIEFWRDEDSGHWEEARKVEASSIGAVLAGLNAARDLFNRHNGEGWSFARTALQLVEIDRLIAEGHSALRGILPAECTQSPPLGRRFDGALLFLAYPLQVVDGTLRDQIVADVARHLEGPYGIRRYLGDSYWCADYKRLLAPEVRTVDVSDDMSARDSLLQPGMEAQWCIFDPIVSVIHGLRYRESRDPAHLEQQTHYLNRSLGQLTGPDTPFGEYRCPESYYCEDGKYVPNDVTPLLWTQANLLLALHHMQESASTI